MTVFPSNSHALGLFKVWRVTFTKPFFASSIVFFGVDRKIASVRRNFMSFLRMPQVSKNSRAYASFRCSIWRIWSRMGL